MSKSTNRRRGKFLETYCILVELVDNPKPLASSDHGRNIDGQLSVLASALAHLDIVTMMLE